MFFMSFRKVHSKYFVLSMSTGIHEVDPDGKKITGVIKKITAF
jgi:hypothetical protein